MTKQQTKKKAQILFFSMPTNYVDIVTKDMGSNVEIACVSSLASGLEKVRALEFDLIVTHSECDDGDPSDLIATAKKLHPKTPIIGVCSDGVSREMLIESGCDSALPWGMAIRQIRKQLKRIK